VLRRAGLVSSRKVGSSVFHAIKDPELIELMTVARRLLHGSLHETHALISGVQEPVTEP
jgi:ArsR family transcriptional regulator